MKHTLVFIMVIAAAGVVASGGFATHATERSGALHVTKECSEYHGILHDHVLEHQRDQAGHEGRLQLRGCVPLAEQRPCPRRPRQQRRARPRDAQSPDALRCRHSLGRDRAVQQVPSEGRRHVRPGGRPVALGRYVHLQLTAHHRVQHVVPFAAPAPVARRRRREMRYRVRDGRRSVRAPPQRCRRATATTDKDPWSTLPHELGRADLHGEATRSGAALTRPPPGHFGMLAPWSRRPLTTIISFRDR
jgi:hypothetical protein